MNEKKFLIISILLMIAGFAVPFLVFPNKEILFEKSEAQLVPFTFLRENGQLYNKEADLIKPKERVSYLGDNFFNLKDKLVSDENDFIEVNIGKMKIYIYKNGKKTKEFSITAKGDPSFWAGTPEGLYSVISKYKIAFSAAAKVYMPWSIGFYGKYYIHGEPYYPNGIKSDFEYTGGCIRLSDNDAKAVYSLAEKGMPILVVNNSLKRDFFLPKAGDDLDIDAKSYLIADMGSGYIFSEKEANKKFPIASITKLMTATVAAENVNLSKTILITENMLNGYGSTIGITKGKVFRLDELFYPLLTESSNDAAEAISYYLGRYETIKMMNEKATAIGMENSFFAGPSGYDPGNISTVQELFYLARYILSARTPFLEISRGDEARNFGEISFKDLRNKNIFFEDDDFIGGKTGFIKQSNYTGIFLFKLNHEGYGKRDIAIIILGSSNIEKATEKTLEWLKDNYSLNRGLKLIY